MGNKVLHISKYYYPYAGGVEDVCYNIVTLLKAENDIEQQVFCFNDCDMTNEDTYDGVYVKRVATNGIVSSQPISLNYKAELRKTIDYFKPDFVHFHAPNPLAAYYLLKVLPKHTKLIIHWHSDIVAQKFLYTIIKPVEKRLLHRADLIVATSPNYVEFSQSLKPFISKTTIIQNAIEPRKFLLSEDTKIKIESIKERYGKKPIIFFIGRHVPYKGIQYLIEAAKFVKNECSVVIGGKGILTEQLKKQAKGIENIYFVGRIDDDMLTAYYYSANILAFPSITRNEAFGVVLAEAMYCGTVPITFTIEGSGVNWVNLDGVTGIECENSNSVQFAQAIDRLLTDKQMAQEMSNSSQHRVNEMFVINKISKQILALYKR